MTRVDQPGSSCTRRMVTFLLLPGFSLMGFSCAVEALSLANRTLRQEAYDWRIASEDGMPVMSHCGVSIAAEVALDQERASLLDSTKPTDVVLCGGPGVAELRLHSVVAWLRECRLRGVSIHSFGSAVALLAEAGLLSGRRCTVHWEQYPSFSERFEDIHVTDGLFEADGSIQTCAGGSSTFDHVLSLVEADFGRSVAQRVSQLALADRLRNGNERQPSPTPGGIRSDHPIVVKAIGLMWEHVEDTLSVPDIALLSGISRRQLERIFAKELNTSPSQQYVRLRLERAHQLLLSSRTSVIDIALSCGFLSASNFSQSFRKTFGYTPLELRDRRP